MSKELTSTPVDLENGEPSKIITRKSFEEYAEIDPDFKSLGTYIEGTNYWYPANTIEKVNEAYVLEAGFKATTFTVEKYRADSQQKYKEDLTKYTNTKGDHLVLFRQLGLPITIYEEVDIKDLASVFKHLFIDFGTNSDRKKAQIFITVNHNDSHWSTAEIEVKKEIDGKFSIQSSYFNSLENYDNRYEGTINEIIKASYEIAADEYLNPEPTIEAPRTTQKSSRIKAPIKKINTAPKEIKEEVVKLKKPIEERFNGYVGGKKATGKIQKDGCSCGPISCWYVKQRIAGKSCGERDAYFPNEAIDLRIEQLNYIKKYHGAYSSLRGYFSRLTPEKNQFKFEKFKTSFETFQKELKPQLPQTLKESETKSPITLTSSYQTENIPTKPHNPSNNTQQNEVLTPNNPHNPQIINYTIDQNNKTITIDSISSREQTSLAEADYENLYDVEFAPIIEFHKNHGPVILNNSINQAIDSRLSRLDINSQNNTQQDKKPFETLEQSLKKIEDDKKSYGNRYFEKIAELEKDARGVTTKDSFSRYGRKDPSLSAVKKDIKESYWYGSSSIELANKAYVLEAGFTQVDFTETNKPVAQSKTTKYQKDGNLIFLAPGSQSVGAIFEVIKKELENDKQAQIFIPINHNNKHWSTLEVKVTKGSDGKFLIKNSYFDPLGNAKVIGEIDTVIEKSARNSFDQQQIAISKSQAVGTKGQADGNSCGPISCWYVGQKAKGEECGTADEKFPSGAIDLRLEQIRYIFNRLGTDIAYNTLSGYFGKEKNAAIDKEKQKLESERLQRLAADKQKQKEREKQERLEKENSEEKPESKKPSLNETQETQVNPEVSKQEQLKKLIRYHFGLTISQETDTERAKGLRILKTLLGELEKNNAVKEMRFGSRQEDASEFLLPLLEVLYEEAPLTETSSIYTEETGYKTKPPKSAPCFSISLVMKDPSGDVSETLYSKRILDNFQKEETRDSNGQVCFVPGIGEEEVEENGTDKLPTKSKTSLIAQKETKEVCLHFKRFKQTEQNFSKEPSTGLIAQKDRREIVLDDISFVSNEAKTDNFRLTGFIYHEGRTLASGHYLSYILEQDPDGKERWYCYNDRNKEVVKNDKETTFLSHKQEAYIAKYTKVGEQLPSSILQKSGTQNLGNTCWANASLALAGSFVSFEQYQNIALTREERKQYFSLTSSEILTDYRIREVDATPKETLTPAKIVETTPTRDSESNDKAKSTTVDERLKESIEIIIKNNIINPTSGKISLTKKLLGYENEQERTLITPALLSLKDIKNSKSKYWYAEFGGIKFEEEKTSSNPQKIFDDTDLFMANFRNCHFKNVDFSQVKNFDTIGFYSCSFEGCIVPEKSVNKDSLEKGSENTVTIEKKSPSTSPKPIKIDQIKVADKQKLV